MSNVNNGILEFFPKKISELIFNKIDFAEEIRLRQAKPIIVKLSNKSEIINHIVTTEEIIECLQKICEYSVYSYQNQISQGFITVKGGHRVGLTGSCVIENNKVININYISSLNFRIARQVIGAGKNVIKEIVKDNQILNTIIISPPGYGKTTILKDVIKCLSSGFDKFEAVNVGVVDERGEIASLYKGIIQNDLGLTVDVIENTPKAVGIKMLVRTMTPYVIVADEIGNQEDVDAINYAFCSGVKGIFTAHGNNYNDFIKNPIMKEIINLNIIDKLVFLDKEKGKIKEVKYMGEEKCFV